MIPTVVSILLGCHLLGVVGGTLPLLSHPLSKVSGISIQPFAGPMALTSFLLASPPLGPSVLRLRSCSPVFVSDIVHTHGSRSGRRMLGCSVGSPLLLCEGSLSSLSVGSCRSLVGDFRVPLLLVFLSLLLGYLDAGTMSWPCYCNCYCYMTKTMDEIVYKRKQHISILFLRNITSSLNQPPTNTTHGSKG